MIIFAKMKKSTNKNYNRLERIIYLLLWVAIAAVPLVIQLYDYITGADQEFEIGKVVNTWLALLPFFLLFWIHDLLLLPLLIRRRLKWLYALLTIGVIAVMITLMDLPHRQHRREREKQSKEIIVTDMETGREIERYVRQGVRRPPINMFIVSNVIFALFAVSLNIGTHLYFRGVGNRRRIAALEAENNATRLQFLKYQINPHFFMNTLNNIHALIDIDAGRAQYVVMELSKLMRYVLYDIDKDKVTLRQEIDFLNNYIELMKIRLTGNVTIDVDMPQVSDDVKVPPLLFIPFVENIFKHGVSYRQPSHITISLNVTDGGDIIFRSSNTRHTTSSADTHHGIGLENLRRRLDLLYPGQYAMEIDGSGNQFKVMLEIPAN